MTIVERFMMAMVIGAASALVTILGLTFIVGIGGALLALFKYIYTSIVVGPMTMEAVLALIGILAFILGAIFGPIIVEKQVKEEPKPGDHWR